MKASELLNIVADRRKKQRDFLAWAALQGIDDQPLPKVDTCGSWLLFREWVEHGGDCTLRNANFCKTHLLCPGCAARRAGKLIDAYLPKVESVMQGLHPVMVTLTVRNNPDLRAGMAQLRRSWTRMGDARRKGLSKSGRHLPVEWCKVAGGVRAFEITRRPGEWNPHLHCFALISDWIDREKLSEEWHGFTGDSFIVDVRRCKKGVRAGLVEVLKYALKFADLGHADRFDAFQSLKGSRLTDPFGLLRGVPEPDIDSDDDSAFDGSWRDYAAFWNPSRAFFDLRPQGEGGRDKATRLTWTRENSRENSPISSDEG